MIKSDKYHYFCKTLISNTKPTKMNKFLSFIFSTRLMAVLFIVFAASMGVATFIENDFGTETARALIYNAWWFEAIMLVFAINFFGNIFKYRLYRKEKLVVLVFHLSFFFILIGAGITRYISYEGLMPIKEGVTTNKFLSFDNFISICSYFDVHFSTVYIFHLQHKRRLKIFGN